MHFLGGFWVGLMALWLYFLSGTIRPKLYQRISIILFSLISVLIIGVLWELFEFFISASNVFGGQAMFDTISDLALDLIGGLLAPFYFIWMKKRFQNNV